ncbi:MAG: hypothetical protein KatS3mg109_0813 [Pirellulaceae bacterium]|nr:MAG: hypothetical protein KatS3mg109_0813 [Pirellulaceae bacterium]
MRAAQEVQAVEPAVDGQFGGIATAPYPLTRRHVLATLVAWGVAATRAAAGPPAPQVHELPVTGEASDRFKELDDLLRAFLIEHRIPGAALAIAHHQRIVFARGIGRADRRQGTPVLPTSRFRIASISKPLTALATARLIEQGRLHWDDHALRLLEKHPEFNNSPIRPADERWHHITVRHLLQHRGGWDRRKSFDPMFRPVEIALWHATPPPATSIQVIRYMLAQPLDFDPGSRAAYSNFGYCVLGRILEAITGEPYEAVVRREVLEPSQAEHTELGNTRVRKDFEVRYYARGEAWGPSVFAEDLGKPSPSPYGAFFLEAMDAHGGWISTAVDLVRISSRLYHPRRPLLSAETRDILLAKPEGILEDRPSSGGADAYFACGWMVRPVEQGINCWHTGSLPGTSTLLVRRFDDMHWAVLFNQRQGRDGRAVATIIDPLLHPLIR